MKSLCPRLFDDDAAVRWIGEGLIHCRLVRDEWTHEAHIAACAYLLIEPQDLVPELVLPRLIRRFNRSIGGTNDADQGYHETITQAFIRAVRVGLRELSVGEGGLAARVNALLASPYGQRDWALSFYSSERLTSREARQLFLEPDLAPLPPLPDQAP